MNKRETPLARLAISGSRACFRRPEFTSDLISYDVMPPTVARRFLHVVLGSPDWALARIVVCKPIRFDWMTIATARGIKRALVLSDVAYILEAYGSVSGVTSGPTTGRTDVHLGLADFPAAVRMLESSEEYDQQLSATGQIDLGWMLYDTGSKDARFFRGTMIDGVIQVARSAIGVLAG